MKKEINIFLVICIQILSIGLEKVNLGRRRLLMRPRMMLGNF